MEENKEVSWDEAISGGNFVKLEAEETKLITIKNWKLVETEKEFSGKKETKIEFQSECIEEDGVKVDKIFNSSSNRLKTKLRAVLEGTNQSDELKLSIIMVGSKFSVQYSVKLVE